MRYLLLFFVLFTAAVAAEDTAPKSVRPILLVPGWGWDYTSLLVGRNSFKRYVNWMVEAGFPQKDIYVLNYNYWNDVDSIGKELEAQIETIVNRYPSGTRFDIMGHSLGGFTALYAILDGRFAARFRKFISLSGIPQGWNGFTICARGGCGKAHTELIPFRSPFVVEFLDKYKSEIDSLEKCSLYSPDDKFVKPYDAGRFDRGTNVEVPGMGHLDTLWKKRFFDVMKSSCYGANWAKPE